MDAGAIIVLVSVIESVGQFLDYTLSLFDNCRTLLRNDGILLKKHFIFFSCLFLVKKRPAFENMLEEQIFARVLFLYHNYYW